MSSSHSLDELHRIVARFHQADLGLDSEEPFDTDEFSAHFRGAYGHEDIASFE